MEETSRNLNELRHRSSGAIRGGPVKLYGNKAGADEAEDGEYGEEDCDAEAWTALSKGFNDVQSVLEENRVLIHQVNENQLSKVPDNLVKNVALICKINRNISEVRRIYSDLSVNFSNIAQQRRSGLRNGGNRKTESSAGS